MDSRTRSISAAKNRAKAVIMQMSEMKSFITLTFSDEDVRGSFYECVRYTKMLLNRLKSVFPDLEYVCGFHLSSWYHAHIILNIPVWRIADETHMLDNSAYKLDVSAFMGSPVYGDTEIKAIDDDEQYYSRTYLCRYLLKDFWYLYAAEYDKAKEFSGYAKIKTFLHSSGMKTIKDIKTSLYAVIDGEETCISGYDLEYENRIKELIYSTYPYDEVDVSREILENYGIDVICKDIMDKNIIKSEDILDYISALIQEQWYDTSMSSDEDEAISDNANMTLHTRFYRTLKALKIWDFFQKRDIYINIYNREGKNFEDLSSKFDSS